MRKGVPKGQGWAFAIGAALLKPLLRATTTHAWIGADKIPAAGGCVLAFNHISHLDPLMSAHLIYDRGRLPRTLAKAELFRNPFLRRVLTSAEQIPVQRHSASAGDSVGLAVAAVLEGECVVVYPEGTLTRDPGLWPMAGRTGAARIALEAGCPLIPVGQWGAQALLAPYAKKPNFWPRKRVTMRVGDPVRLDDLRDRPRTAAVLAEATDRLMAALTALVADIRDEAPPPRRLDLRDHPGKDVP
ncbi:MAG: lysophospholipid acyltransferase family protein [Nocardioides sp.]